MPQSSQLQPLPDKCLYSRATSHHRLDPLPIPVTILLHACILERPCLWDYLIKYIPHTPPLHPTTPPHHSNPPPHPTTNKFCQEVNVKITRYLPDSSAIHPYLNRSCQPMEAVGDGVESIPGQTLLSKRQCGFRGRPYIRASADIPTYTSADTHISFALPDLCSAGLPLFEIQHREFSITARVPGVEIEITNFLLCLTLNSQLWVMKSSPAEESKSSLHGCVVSCKDAIIQQPQTKSCHPPGGQWSMTKESSWKHLRI